MFRRLAVPLVLLILLTACTSKGDTSSTTTTQTQAGDFSVSTRFSPDPPKQGPETITVTVKDTAGNAIKGATVKIASNMPSMSMSGPTLTATDNGDGTYSAQTNLNYATQWIFDVAVAANGKRATARVTQDVK